MYKDEATYILGSYLPDGKAFEAKYIPDKNLYKLLDAIAKSFILFHDDIMAVFLEMDPATTEDLINRWEEEYGMAKSCFGIAPTLQERRDNLLLRLKFDGVQTLTQFQDLITSVGYSINIIPGIDYYSFPLPFPGPPVFLDEKAARFTIVVQLPKSLSDIRFPFDVPKFPIPFGSGESNVIECLIKKLIPANVNAEFYYVL